MRWNIVNKPAFVEIYIVDMLLRTCTKKFFGKHRYVKPIGIKPCKITIFKLVVKFWCKLFEGWGFLNFFVGYSCKFCHFMWNWLPWVYKEITSFFRAVRIDFYERDLYDAVFN